MLETYAKFMPELQLPHLQNAPTTSLQTSGGNVVRDSAIQLNQTQDLTSPTSVQNVNVNLGSVPTAPAASTSVVTSLPVWAKVIAVATMLTVVAVAVTVPTVLLTMNVRRERAIPMTSTREINFDLFSIRKIRSVRRASFPANLTATRKVLIGLTSVILVGGIMAAVIVPLAVAAAKAKSENIEGTTTAPTSTTITTVITTTATTSTSTTSTSTTSTTSTSTTSTTSTTTSSTSTSTSTTSSTSTSTITTSTSSTSTSTSTSSSTSTSTSTSTTSSTSTSTSTTSSTSTSTTSTSSTSSSTSTTSTTSTSTTTTSTTSTSTTSTSSTSTTTTSTTSTSTTSTSSTSTSTTSTTTTTTKTTTTSSTTTTTKTTSTSSTTSTSTSSTSTTSTTSTTTTTVPPSAACSSASSSTVLYNNQFIYSPTHQLYAAGMLNNQFGIYHAYGYGNVTSSSIYLIPQSSTPAGAFFAAQNDRNLVVYTSTGGVLWAAGVYVSGLAAAFCLEMQDNGNLVWEDTSNNIYWQSNTAVG